MDSLTSGTPNPTNNPRMNLLNGSGTNSQINSTSNNAFEASAFHARPVPQPNPANAAPLASANSAPKSDYVKAASKKPAPAAPKPAVAPAPQSETPKPPEPRPVPAAPVPPKSRKPLIVGLIILLLIAIGAAVGWWLLSQSQPQEPTEAPRQLEAVNPTELSQQTTDGEQVTAGSKVAQGDIKLSFTVETDANEGSLTPEVEVRPVGSSFTGEATHTGDTVSAGGSNLTPSVTVENLENGQYQWQARVKVGEQTSEWIVFGDVGATTPAFIIEAAATTAQATAIQSVSGVTAANPTNITTANPVFTGSSEPNASITVTVADKSFKGTANASGTWSVTADQPIANGQYQVNVIATDAGGATVGQTTLSLVVAVAAATPPPTASSSAPAATPSAAAPAAPAPAASDAAATTQQETLAATGDNPVATTLAGVALSALAITGLVWARRRYVNVF